MKLKIIALLATLIASVVSFNVRAAVIDPIYILSTGYCNVYQVYLTDDGYLFGKEIGCSDSAGTIIGGYWAGGAKVSFSVPSSSGGLAMFVYDLSAMSRVRAFISADGMSLGARTTNPFTYQLDKPYGTFANKLPNELDRNVP